MFENLIDFSAPKSKLNGPLFGGYMTFSIPAVLCYSWRMIKTLYLPEMIFGMIFALIATPIAGFIHLAKIIKEICLVPLRIYKWLMMS